AVLVEREQASAIRLGPLVAEIDRHADVRVAAAAPIVLAAGFARIDPILAGVPVPMVGVHFDRFIDQRVGVDRVRATEVGARYQVPQMAVDCVDEEGFAAAVPIVSPGVRRAVAQGLELLAPRMISPDAAAQWSLVFLGRVGPAD